MESSLDAHMLHVRWAMIMDQGVLGHVFRGQRRLILERPGKEANTSPPSLSTIRGVGVAENFASNIEVARDLGVLELVGVSARPHVSSGGVRGRVGAEAGAARGRSCASIHAN